MDTLEGFERPHRVVNGHVLEKRGRLLAGGAVLEHVLVSYGVGSSRGIHGAFFRFLGFGGTKRDGATMEMVGERNRHWKVLWIENDVPVLHVDG